MAAEAEAAREARAKVIAAEGEQNASRALKEAADIIASSPAALQVIDCIPPLTYESYKNIIKILQLRYLQTLTTIATEKNSTIIFPLPMDLITRFTDK